MIPNMPPEVENFVKAQGVDKKQAENIWKMLDQMAQNQPENYQNFVQKNIKQGAKQYQAQFQQKQNKLKITPNAGHLLKVRLKLSQSKLNQIQNEQISNKFLINPTKQISIIKKNIQNQIKMNINICYSKRVKNPLNQHNNEIKNINKNTIKDIRNIPISLQEIKQKKNSCNQNVLYAIIICSEDMYKLMISQVNTFSGLNRIGLDFVLNKLKQPNNILSQYYNPKEYNMVLYYKQIPNSLQVCKSKKFKYLNHKNTFPVLLQSYVDKQQKYIPKQQQKPEFKYKQQPPTNLPKQQINLPKPKQIPKKILIEQVKDYKQDSQLKYQITSNAQQHKLEIKLHQNIPFKEIQLFVSQNQVRIKARQKSLQIKLPTPVNPQKIIAKKKGLKLDIIMKCL